MGAVFPKYIPIRIGIHFGMVRSLLSPPPFDEVPETLIPSAFYSILHSKFLYEKPDFDLDKW
jgi:hypothetical protein